MAFAQEQVANLPEWLKDFYRSTGAIETPAPIVEAPVYQQAPYSPQYVRPRVQGDMRSEGDGQIMPSMPMDSEGMFDIGGSLLAGAKGLFDGLTNEVTDTFNSIGNFVDNPSKTIAEELGFSSPSKTDKMQFSDIRSPTSKVLNKAGQVVSFATGSPFGLVPQFIANQLDRSVLNEDLAKLSFLNTGNDPKRIGFLDGLFSNQEELARDYLGDFSAPESFDGFVRYNDLKEFSKETGQDMSNITNVDQMFSLMDAGFTIQNGEWTPPDTIQNTWTPPDAYEGAITNLDTYVAPTIYQSPHTGVIDYTDYGDSFDDGVDWGGGSGMDAQGNADGQDDSGYGDDDTDDGESFGGLDGY